MLLSSFPPLCAIAFGHPISFRCHFVPVVVTCRHPSCAQSTQQLLTPPPFHRLATFARIQAKNHSVAHSPHAKSVSPALTSSLVMRAYTVTITVRLLLAGLVKRTRRLYPLLMAGMMRMLLSPGELRKRRLGAEQIATMRCVPSISSLALLQSSNAGMCHPRSPMLAPSIPQDAQAHPLRCQPTLSLLRSPRCQA